MIGKLLKETKKIFLDDEAPNSEQQLEVKPAEQKPVQLKETPVDTTKTPEIKQQEDTYETAPFSQQEGNQIPFGLLDFEQMAYVLGIKNIVEYKKQYFENTETWYDNSFNIFLALERELVNTLTNIQITTAENNNDDIPTTAKKYLIKVEDFRNNMDNFSKIEKFREDAKSFTKLSTLCDNLELYSKHMKSYILLEKALSSLNYFCSELMKERKKAAVSELETVKGYRTENEILKKKQNTIISTLKSLKSKYSDSLNELAQLEADYAGEVKNDNPPIQGLPKIKPSIPKQ